MYDPMKHKKFDSFKNLTIFGQSDSVVAIEIFVFVCASGLTWKHSDHNRDDALFLEFYLFQCSNLLPGILMPM